MEDIKDVLINPKDYIGLGYFCSLTNRNPQTVYRWHYTGSVKSIEMDCGEAKTAIFIHRDEIERCYKPKDSLRSRI